MFAESGLFKQHCKIHKNADFHVSHASSCKQFFVKILYNLYMKMSIAAETDFEWFWKSKISQKRSKLGHKSDSKTT